MKSILNLKREQFHINQGKSKRDHILQTKRKFMLQGGDICSEEPMFAKIHKELINESLNREDIISEIIMNPHLMEQIIRASIAGGRIALLILHNLCWSECIVSLKRLINHYQIHVLFMDICMNSKGDLIDICLGGICNLLGVIIDEVMVVTEYCVKKKLIDFFIRQGNTLVDQNNYDIQFREIIRTTCLLFESVKYFRIERILTSQMVFDLFKLSIRSFQTQNQVDARRMYRIIIMSTEYLDNLIEFLDDQWISEFLRYMSSWLKDQTKYVNLSFKVLIALFERCQATQINRFFYNGELEQLIFLSPNKEWIFNILKRIIDSDQLAYFFQSHSNDIFNVFSECSTLKEIEIGVQFIFLLFEYFEDILDSCEFSGQDILFMLEDKYILAIVPFQQKIPILNCIYWIIFLKDINISNNLRYQMEKDYNEYSNTVFSNTIDKIFDELVDR